MILKLSLYESTSSSIFTNLAAEEYLVSQCGLNEVVLFLWQNDRTVVIGRNQNVSAECDIDFADRHYISIARRLSGGGAVYHDLGNLNYTFLFPNRLFSKKLPMEIAREAISYDGIHSNITGRNDIEINGRKVSGIAIYEGKDVSFLHGCIMIHVDLDILEEVLTVNTEKIQTKGIRSVRSRVINLEEVCPSVSVEQVKIRMIETSREHLHSEGNEIVRMINEAIIPKELVEKYKSREWTYGRDIPVSFCISKHFDWGCCDIVLSSNGNNIRECKVYTDALEPFVFPRISDALKDCKLKKLEIKKRMESITNTSSGEKKMIHDLAQCMMEDLNINE